MTAYIWNYMYNIAKCNVGEREARGKGALVAERLNINVSIATYTIYIGDDRSKTCMLDRTTNPFGRLGTC